MRRVLHFLTLVFALGLLSEPALAAGAAPAKPEMAPESSEAAAMPAETMPPPAAPDASPWEHPLWHNATSMMRIYLCDHARRPPSWCGAPKELPANAELPDLQGPPLHDEDARWLAFLEEADPGNLSAADVETIRRRAVERRDPQAMEILGFLYAQGDAVELDYAEAYRWYGLAYLSGETRVRANMDIVWQQLQRTDLEGALALTRQFDALAAGQAPDSLQPAVAPAPGDSAGPQGDTAPSEKN